MRTLAKDLENHLNKEVVIEGWLNNVRSIGKVNFLILRDRSGFIQVVVDKEEYQKISGLHSGSILRINGKVASQEKGFEIVEPKITVVVPIKEAPPIEYYKPELNCELDFILDNRPIALRHRREQAIFKIQAELTHAYRLFMHDAIGAVEYFAPNMLGASSEGGAEFFNVDYFGHTATLAQSSQLYKQIMVGVNERVYALMPFFRAENSNTPRHLTEGKQFEFEMGFFNHWTEVMDVQEACIKFMLHWLQKVYPEEIELLGNNIVKAPVEVPFPRLTFAEAQELYYKRTGIDERHEPDLSPAAERELCKYALEEHGTELIFITDWQTVKRPFYAFPNEENPKLTNTFDLLCAGTEITSGGQRRHTYESMVEGILSKGMNPSSFTDYLSIFKYGMPPHGGFGMGLERLTMTLLRLKNIREASLFPSDPKRIAGNRIKAKIFFGQENVRNEIIRLLHKENIEFEQGDGECSIKSLILRGKNSKKNYQINILTHRKVDMKAVADKVGEKCEFEDAEVIKERFGLDTRSIPPFGHLLNLDTYYDEEIAKSAKSGFISGRSQELISLATKDLLSLAQPQFGVFSKNDS